MKKSLSAALAAIRTLWSREPVRVSTWTAAAIVVIASRLGVVLSQLTVLNDVEIVLPLLLGGEVARTQVTCPATLAKILALIPAKRATKVTPIKPPAPTKPAA